MNKKFDNEVVISQTTTSAKPNLNFDEKKSGRLFRLPYMFFVGLAVLNILVIIVSMAFGLDEYMRHATFNNLGVSVTAILVMLIPLFIKGKLKVNISPIIEELYLIYIFFALLLGFGFSFYEDVGLYDKIFHLLSGALFAIMIVDLISNYNRKNESSKSLISPVFVTSFAFAATTTLLVIWEVYEFVIDTITFNLDEGTRSNMQRYLWNSTSPLFPQPYGLFDTMMDLILGVIGALIMAVVAFVVLRKRDKKHVA